MHNATQAELINSVFTQPQPILVLAPMQDVTDLPFWRLMAQYGGPDVYFTEFFRVHASSSLERHIVQAIEHAPPGRPVIAQMIGNDIEALARTARLLQRLPIAGWTLTWAVQRPWSIGSARAAASCASPIASMPFSPPCVRS